MLFRSFAPAEGDFLLRRVQIDHNPDSPTATFILVTPQGAEASSLTSIEVYSFEKEVYTQLAMNTVRL